MNPQPPILTRTDTRFPSPTLFRSDAKPFALVGKGITFDTGGVNLKTQGGIEEMKYDMCGGATVIGTFVAAVKMKLPINLVVVVPAVENAIDGNAYRPSEIGSASCRERVCQYV